MSCPKTAIVVSLLSVPTFKSKARACTTSSFTILGMHVTACLVGGSHDAKQKICKFAIPEFNLRDENLPSEWLCMNSIPCFMSSVKTSISLIIFHVISLYLYYL